MKTHASLGRAKYLLRIVILFLFFWACEDSPDLKTPVSKKTLTESPTLDYLRARGFPDSAIEEFGDYYQVEGDMLFRKNMVSGDPGRKPHAEQVSVDKDDLIDGAEVTDISVFVHESIPAGDPYDDWRTEAEQACNDWNSVPGTLIHFTYTTSEPADITIYHDAYLSTYLPDNAIANAEVPWMKKPGAIIRINLDAIDNHHFTSGQKRRTMVHELGHTLGLMHTNWFDMGEGDWPHVEVEGTPCEDGNSVMRTGYMSPQSFAGFSAFDVIAAQTLYPSVVRPAGVHPFFRYYSSTMTNHFYTINWNEVGCGDDSHGSDEHGGLKCQGIEGYMWDYPAPGTIPIYRFYKAIWNDHYYTRDSATPSGYVSEGIAGYAYLSWAPGRIGVNRYWNTNARDHFYTTVSGSYPGYGYQRVEWYALQ